MADVVRPPIHPPTSFERGFYQFARTVLHAYCTPWRVVVEHAERVPTTGACVLAPSHRSMMDIPFVSYVTRRRIRFMGKVEVFRLPVLGRVFSALGAYPLERNGRDAVAVKAALEVLEAGEPLAIFPEGTRRNGPTIQPLEEGAMYLGLRAGVPVIPIGIHGSEEILRSRSGPLPGFARVAVSVGEPIVPPPREGKAVSRALVRELTAELHTRVQAAFDRAAELRDA